MVVSSLHHELLHFFLLFLKKYLSVLHLGVNFTKFVVLAILDVAVTLLFIQTEGAHVLKKRADLILRSSLRVLRRREVASILRVLIGIGLSNIVPSEVVLLVLLIVIP